MASSDIVIRLEFIHVESFFPFSLVSQEIIDQIFYNNSIIV